MSDIKKIIIMGGGPSGLAAGLELIKNGHEVIIFEADAQVGGISRTVNYNGYYFDIGGHRFFTKEEEVNKLWEEVMPQDFLIRPRLSRIFYNNKFFYYPLKPWNALVNVGLLDSLAIMFSYLGARLKYYLGQKKPAANFEEWVSERFGNKLFKIFFKTYTEKVWGISTTELGADWAAQRIKGLSLSGAIKDAFFPSKNKLTSLIEEFRYPKYGVGMMYDKMAEKFEALGGKIALNSPIVKINKNDNIIESVVVGTKDGEIIAKADNYISSIPLTQLAQITNPAPDQEIIDALGKLRFRAFITVCLILDVKDSFEDNWIYIHSPEVKVGRIQNFKRWSPYMVPDENKTTLGLEYFCFVGDDLWNLSQDELIKLAKKELQTIGLGQEAEVSDGMVVKLKYVYPVYQIGYKEPMEKIIKYVSKFQNLQIIGRGGIFRYDNMDHAILTGLYAARNIMGASYDILNINTEEEYHEVGKNKQSD
jgi:protoporphyrinogen oxidase